MNRNNNKIWECDICNREMSANGFPEYWIKIKITTGHSIETNKYEVNVDCCSQECANKVVLNYYSEHRLDD